jgi:hypothetical protein
MKQRITYVVQNPEEFSPEQLVVKSDEQGPLFALKGVQAAKEHRVTLGLDELPRRVRCQPLHFTTPYIWGIPVVLIISYSLVSFSHSGMKCICDGSR